MLARYLHGDEFDQTFARVDLRAANASERVQWYLTDHLNSVRLVLDASGAILDQIAYDAFGNIVAQLNPLFDNPLLFTSREFDAETGLYYNRARYLDPTTGRWTTQDPLGFAAGDANLYRYVGNRATLATDPSGNIWYPGKYIIQYFREWRRGRELDAQLDELQRRRHDPLAAVMQPSSGPWTVRHSYEVADPSFDRNWRQGLGDAATLANFGAQWAAFGGMIAIRPIWGDPNKVAHLFAPKHNLVGRIGGSQVEVMANVDAAVQAAAAAGRIPQSGVFRIQATINDHVVTITGAVVNGEVRYGSIWIP